MSREQGDGGAAAHLIPMAATTAREVPAGEDWVFEPKYDGVRVLAFVESGGARLVTRNGKGKTDQFPEVAAALAALGSGVSLPLVLDGELVALEGDRPARFQAIQERVHLKDRAAVRERVEETPAALLVFDILQQGRTLLVDRPWSERRAALEKCVGGAALPELRVSDTLAGSGEEALGRARREGWEGVIAKRRDAPYRPGKRSHDWRKLKIEFRQEFVVGGWTDPQRTRPHLGSLLVGYYDAEDALVFAGGVGTGFDREGLRQMRLRLDRLARKSSPFAEPPRTRTPAHWVRPEVVVEIRFAEWTADGRLRQPVFLGVRDDKRARDVTRESASVQ